MSNPLPDCAWLEISIHVTSDATGLQAAIKVGGAKVKNIYDNDWLTLIKYACGLLNEMGETDDARPMTGAEVKVYRENDDEEEE